MAVDSNVAVGDMPRSRSNIRMAVGAVAVVAVGDVSRSGVRSGRTGRRELGGELGGSTTELASGALELGG